MLVTFSELVSQIADSGWGKECENKDDAEKALIKDKQSLNAFALLELIKRLNAIGKAAGKADTKNDREITIGKDAKKFPHKEVGDRLFHGDLEDGIAEYVIIAKDSEHHCMIVMINNFHLHYPPAAGIACGYHKESIVDAVKEAATSDLMYHGGRSANAKAALDAATKGEDVSAFIDGYEEPEGDETESA